MGDVVLAVALIILTTLFGWVTYFVDINHVLYFSIVITGYLLSLLVILKPDKEAEQT